MKTSEKTIKRMSLIALFLTGAVSVNANPLTYILSESTGLDLVYVVLGISAIWMLLFFEGYTGEEKTEQSVIKVRSNDDNHHHRRVVKKTS